MKPIPAFLTLLLTSGCSLVFVDGPPQVRPGAAVPATATCTTTRLVSVADGLLSAGWGIMATRLLTEEGANPQVEDYLLAYALPVLMAGSAVEGWRRVSRCQEFMLSPVSNEEATATYETYFPRRHPMLRPPMLLPSVQPRMVLGDPSRFPAWFESKGAGPVK